MKDIPKSKIQNLKVFDSHVHFWNYDASNPEFDWIDEGMDNIKKSFLPQDLINCINNQLYVGRETVNYQLSTINYSCIAVQAAPSWQETEFLLNLASKYDFIKGVIGWIDFEDSVQNHQLSTNNYQLLKGFRHIIQSESHGYMSSDVFRYFISKLKNNNYTYDLLLKPHQLSEALELVQEFPNQKFVIDHLAKPDIRNQDVDQWKSDIQEFKHLPNVYCKLSGMVTEAYWQSWQKEDFTKVLDVAFQTFGTDRLMYGSDWPVCLLAADYQQVYEIVASCIERLSEAEQQKIMCHTAMTFYNISI